MTKTQKKYFIFLSCLLVVLAIFSFGLTMLISPVNVLAETGNDDATVVAEKNITITAYYEDFNSGNGGIFTKGANGGYFGEDASTCNKQSITVTIGTESQKAFYARANTGFYLEGIYSNQDFTGDSLNFSLNEDVYSITYNSETSSQYYAKFCLKRITITLENGADFTLSGGGTYLYGATFVIKCEENSQNYKFSRWAKVVGEDVSTLASSSSYRLTATESMRIRAIPKILVGTKDCVNGDIEIRQNNVVTTERYFEKGTNLTIKAVPNTGYSFVNYDVDEFASSAQEFDYTVQSPLSFGAIFESKKVTITISTDNAEEADITGCTVTDGNQYVIGDEIVLNVSTTTLFGLDQWQTNAYGTFDVHALSQTYTITPQDAEEGTLTFVAKIKKMLASCEIIIGTGEGNQGGMLYINDSHTTTVFKEDKALSSTYTITAKETKNHYLSNVFYKSSSSSAMQDWTNKLVDGKLVFDVTEDFVLTFYFSPLTWVDIKVEPKGLGTEGSPYLIGSAEELAYMAWGINTNVKGENGTVDYREAYFKLTDNISLDGRYWILIGANNGAEFTGTLDLNYKFISDITLVYDSYSSNLKYLFTDANFQTANIIHDADNMWRILGISSSAFFAVAITLVVVAILTNNNSPKAKKVVVLQDDDKQKK